jgi:50S ribosomal protein L16 3-hydroxylase
MANSVDHETIPDLAGFLAGFISRYRLAHQPAPPEPQQDLPTLQQELTAGAVLHRNPWTRLNWLESEAGARLFAAGDEFRCSPQLASALCSQAIVIADFARLSSGDQACILQMLNQGHLYLHKPDEAGDWEDI